MANGMMTMGNAGSPMMQVNQFPEGMQMDYRNNMQAGQPMQAGGGGPQSGNHALQDYQMQLMLLEQQNKKRLMMARQEQHENNPGGGPMPGVNMPAPGMSPGGSRTGTSPNPGDQMKRNPGMGALPGSPSAGDAMQGRSPAAMGFMNGMQAPDFNGAMFMGKDQPMMSAGGPGMRPPTSAEINAMRQQGSRVNQPFQGRQPMQQQTSQGGQQAMATPGQRNDMPPPQAPAGGNSAQRNQGASPGANAPPTPSQTNKANPKNKKGAKNEDTKKVSNHNLVPTRLLIFALATYKEELDGECTYIGRQSSGHTYTINTNHTQQSRCHEQCCQGTGWHATWSSATATKHADEHTANATYRPWSK